MGDRDEHSDRDGSDRESPSGRSGSAKKSAGKPANVAPDAVKDPSEKTDGKPGLPQKPDGGEADPGSG